PDHALAIPLELGAVRGARHLGGAISDQPRRGAAPAGGRRLRRISAARFGAERGCVPPQSPHRAETDGAMSAPLRLRPYAPADEEVLIELWRRSWQQAYPDIDFSARLAWWRERWRKELVSSASITVAERACTIVGCVTIDP